MLVIDPSTRSLGDDSTSLLPLDQATIAIPPSPTISQSSELTPSIEDLSEMSDGHDTEQMTTPLLSSGPMRKKTRRVASLSTYTPSNATSSSATTESNHAQHDSNFPSHGTFGQVPAPVSSPAAPPADNRLRNTAQPYSYKQQRWQVWRIAVGEFMATTILCTLYVAAVVRYSHKDNMYPADQSWFNAITQTVTFLLGISIANAFRSYAKCLRWRILAAKPRPLETFDLILASDSLANVFKLLYRGGRRGIEETKGFKKYLPSRTQICCVCCIVFKVTIIFLVGYAGSLTTLTPGDAFVGIHQGNVTFTDFAMVGGIDNHNHLKRIRTWASRGFRCGNVSSLDHFHASLSTVSRLENGTSAYWPAVMDAADHTIRAVSYFQIRADANCTAYNVTDGHFGNKSEITYIDDHGNTAVYTFPDINQVGPGGWLASSWLNSTCGPRCVNVDAFVAQTKPNQPIFIKAKGISVTYEQAKFFRCTNTVGHVMYDADRKGGLTVANYTLDDSWAQMVAGTVGWESEGDGVDLDDLEDTDGNTAKAMFAPYPVKSELGKWLASEHEKSPNATMMADAIASFSMVALVAIDDSHLGLLHFSNKTSDMPLRRVTLQIQTISAVGILGTVILGQFAVLVLVFVFANGAIIGSDNPLSIAKLYYSLLRRRGLGEVGSLLDSRELIKRIDDRDVIYGWTNIRDEEGEREVRHLDVFDAGDEQVFGDFQDEKVHYYD